jgi:hypothetical protein
MILTMTTTTKPPAAPASTTPTATSHQHRHKQAEVLTSTSSIKKKKKMAAARFTGGWRRNSTKSHDRKETNTQSQHNQHRVAVVLDLEVVVETLRMDAKWKKNNTRYSNVVPHRSTNLARSCLTSLSRREAVLS